LEFRSLFKKMFGREQPPTNTSNKSFELVSTQSSFFTPYSGDLMKSDIVRSAIRPIVNAVGKLSPKHIRNGKINPEPYLKELLRRPNQYMSMQDFLSKMTWHRELTHNAFAYVKRDGMGFAEAIYPIPVANVELMDVAGEPWAKFRFWTGKYMTVPYTDLIHLRKDFNSNDFYGDGGTYTLDNVMEVINTTDQGIVKTIRNSAVIKWIMKFKNVLKPEHMKLHIDEFVENYLSVTSKGGAAASNSLYDLEQVKENNIMPNALMGRDSVQRVFNYFGVNEKIVQNNYNEDEWNAFYSSKIEEIAIQLTDAFTQVIFTSKERGHDNSIVFSAKRLTFASNTTKTNMARELIPLGLFTVNEMRAIFELEPVEGGNVRFQTLNVVNADMADKYQLGEDEKIDKEVTEDDNEGQGIS